VGALKALPDLRVLNLACPTLTNYFVADVAGLKQLRQLSLAGCNVSDEGLTRLHGLAAVRELDVSGTKVSAEGVAALQKALPDCRVVLEPTKPATGEAVLRAAGDVERRAAESALAQGGKVKVRTREGERVVAVAGQLPAGPFDLVGLQVVGTGFTPNWMVNVEGLANLRELKLNAAYIRPEDTYRHFQSLKTLRDLDLSGEWGPGTTAGLRLPAGLESLRLNSNWNDAALEFVRPLTNLRSLDLGDTRATDAGLTAVVGLPNLKHLVCGFSRLTNAGTRTLGRLGQLEYLSLADAPVTDAGLDPLGKLTALKELDLTGTKVTAAGVDKLSRQLPQCRITGPRPAE
jgi:Leucine-rich repeat (LRR) protein